MFSLAFVIYDVHSHVTHACDILWFTHVDVSLAMRDGVHARMSRVTRFSFPSPAITCQPLPSATGTQARTLNPKPQTLIPQPKTLNPKPETLIQPPKPKTQNPKPKSLKP